MRRKVLASCMCFMAPVFLMAVPMASQQWASNRIEDAVSGVYSNVYTKQETDAKIIELAPPPGDYFEVSNKAMTAIQTLSPATSYVDHAISDLTRTNAILSGGPYLTKHQSLDQATNYADSVAFRAAHDATNYTDRAISTGNVAFVEAVTNCPIFAEFPDENSQDGLGQYGTLGALLAAFAAAIALLNKNKADASAVASDISGVRADLAYAMVTPGEWEFSGGSYGQGYYIIISSDGRGGYNYDLYLAEDDTFLTEENKPTDDVLSVFFEAADMTATRASLPGHLLDRAVNAVPVSTDTTLTLPALVNAGKARDFLVRLAISGSTVPTITFAAPTGETIVYETDGDEFPVPDEAGTWLYSFTETAAHTFAVSLKKVNTVAAPQAQGGS